MAKQRTINTNAEYGIDSEVHYDGGVTLTFSSRRHKIRLRINDDQVSDLAEAGWKLVGCRERQVENLRAWMREPNK